ncbi:hypothetical protein JMY81_21760 [Brenneria goodwinii]|uniref:hypothetical protein n=1 Tax=Brenneria goodwinii TaxID=1109412 RepID=UPI000EF1F155|nr:hypothetical protein [Brenneria goodwinii]MCG8158776.1 hypothetical protein [Brenneria goodwinii]MCG8163421.1 hypothetical protein [Brenneria goodwinii]MCG8167905.1 hypothetical protein [Brenneria goodwinii]MCG8172572.1 hypothetical protein [Brenneria goodwinii]MCG8177233.1 hypothetical protein [Brenneria goodwinii]
MGPVIMMVGVVMFMLAILVWVFSMVYFGLHRKKYEQLISLYRQEGLPLSAQNNLMSFLGYWGSFSLALFFKRVLDGKPINIAPKQPLPPEVYAFVASQSRELTGWIRVYYYIHAACFSMFVIGSGIAFFGKWQGWY